MFIALIMLLTTRCEKRDAVRTNNKYEDLVNFFKEWHEFQIPSIVDGPPDYTASAMTEYWFQIPVFTKQHSNIDVNG